MFGWLSSNFVVCKADEWFALNSLLFFLCFGNDGSSFNGFVSIDRQLDFFCRRTFYQNCFFSPQSFIKSYFISIFEKQKLFSPFINLFFIQYARCIFILNFCIRDKVSLMDKMFSWIRIGIRDSKLARYDLYLFYLFCCWVQARDVNISMCYKHRVFITQWK